MLLADIKHDLIRKRIQWKYEMEIKDLKVNMNETKFMISKKCHVFIQNARRMDMQCL